MTKVRISLDYDERYLRIPRRIKGSLDYAGQFTYDIDSTLAHEYFTAAGRAEELRRRIIELTQPDLPFT
jgi:hypothetical protein